MKRHLNYLVIAVLLILTLAVPLLGIVEANAGLNMEIYHKYLAYLFVALILVHLTLSLDRISIYLRHGLGKEGERRVSRFSAVHVAVPAGAVIILLAGIAAASLYYRGELERCRSRADLVARRLEDRKSAVKPMPDMESREAGRETISGEEHERGKEMIKIVHEYTSHTTESIFRQFLRPAVRGPMEFYRNVEFTEEIALPPEPPRGIMSRNGVAAVQSALPVPVRNIGEVTASDKSCGRFADTPLTLNQITALLYLSNGITYYRTYSGTEHHFRSAPSAGALYPAMIYCVIKKAEELKPGLYYYHEKRHVLQLIKKGDFSRELLLFFEGDRRFEDAPVVFLYTGMFERSERKYTGRGYRYTFLDTGHVSGNTWVAASSLGLSFVQSSLFLDSHMNSFLGVDGIDEALLMGTAVGFEKADSGEPVKMPRRELTSALIKLTPMQKEKADLDPTESFHLASARTAEDIVYTEPPPLSRKKYEDATIVTLDTDFVVPGQSPVRLINERRSLRKYTGGSIDAGIFSSLFYLALGGRENGERALPPLDGFFPLETYIIVNDVKGLDRGIYHYLPGTHSLEVIERRDPRRHVMNAALDQEFAGDGAFIVVFTGKIEELSRRIGARAYRTALLAAGRAGENVYLAAGALGMGACDIGAYYDGRLDALLQIDGAGEMSLLMVVVGGRS